MELICNVNCSESDQQNGKFHWYFIRDLFRLFEIQILRFKVTIYRLEFRCKFAPALIRLWQFTKQIYVYKAAKNLRTHAFFNRCRQHAIIPRLSTTKISHVRKEPTETREKVKLLRLCTDMCCLFIVFCYKLPFLICASYFG